MKRYYNNRVFFLVMILLFLFAVVAVSLRPVPAVSGAQSEQSYVLMAPQWGAEQDAAVSDAGGVVTFSHRQSGIGIVRSGATDFLERAEASNKFTVALDEVVQWQMPTQTVELDETAVTPGNETFINLQWNIKAIDAPGAWDAGFDGSGVRVAVIDGGIYSAHQDLDGNLDVAASRSFVPGFNFNQDVGTF